jgi:prolyl-tRNA synthetase
MEVGPRDIAEGKVVLARRDTGEKSSVTAVDALQVIPKLLDEIQENLFEQARSFRETHTKKIESYVEFKSFMNETSGFAYCGWDGTEETEQAIKTETKATIRCIPLSETPKGLKCIYSGKPAKHEVVFAKAY